MRPAARAKARLDTRVEELDRERFGLGVTRRRDATGRRLPDVVERMLSVYACSHPCQVARSVFVWERAARKASAPTRPYFLYHFHAALGENDLAFAARGTGIGEANRVSSRGGT